MKIRDLAAAVREYPRLRQALEESRTELETSKLECRRLLDQLNELEWNSQENRTPNMPGYATCACADSHRLRLTSGGR